MPQCVLCLRLIGLSWDLYDGARMKKNPESLSKDQQKTALTSSPNVLEMLSHSFFIGGYFVGPQFSLAKYREFVSPQYQSSLPASPVPFGLKRLGLSVVYMTAHVVGSMFLPELWPITDSFAQTSFAGKLLLLPVWVKLILAKYLSMWLMAEGVCAVAGLSYVPTSDPESEINWSGCANVKLRRLESAQKFGHYIEAFNINTNAWVMNYVYKRLKFLNNRYISQMSALVFLAVWHGWHSGYYITFLNEFLVVNFEKDFASTWDKSGKDQNICLLIYKVLFDFSQGNQVEGTSSLQHNDSGSRLDILSFLPTSLFPSLPAAFCGQIHQSLCFSLLHRVLVFCSLAIVG